MRDKYIAVHCTAGRQTQTIADLQEKNTALTLENQSLKFKKCEVRGCKESGAGF